MRTYFVNQKISELQDQLYSKLNNFSQSNKTLGRFCSIPVSILDVALDTFKSPLGAIEYVAMAAINLIGAAFSKEFTLKGFTFKELTLKDALGCTEFALGAAVNIPVKLVVAPVKIIFQFIAIIINPEKVQSINYLKPTFQA